MAKLDLSLLFSGREWKYLMAGSVIFGFLLAEVQDVRMRQVETTKALMGLTSIVMAKEDEPVKADAVLPEKP